MITQKRLKELFHYDEETGVFTRKVITTNSAKLNEVAGTIHPIKKYRYMRVDNVRYLAHRLAWLYVYGTMPTKQIDHINGIRDDNRIKNLRDVDASTNAENKRRTTTKSKSNFLGVTQDKEHKKWKAQIVVKGVYKYLGFFTTEEEAHKAYLQAKRQFHQGCTI
jgi:hypothetical protein